MSYPHGCFICGIMKTTRYRAKKLQVICDECAIETPDKVDANEFEKQLWGTAEEIDKIPSNTRYEFWIDYLRSSSTLEEYVEFACLIEDPYSE